MAKIPNVSGPKDLPDIQLKTPDIPDQTKLSSAELEEVPKLKIVPEQTALQETIPEASKEKEEMPSTAKEENCVIIGEQKIELKPTKLKYFRNKAASAYGIIKAVPLHELLTYGKGVLDENRDADQLLFDFLVAAFDDSTFVRKNYDDFDAENIDKVVKIFGRLNHIDEKEEAARKNKEAQAKR